MRRRLGNLPLLPLMGLGVAAASAQGVSGAGTVGAFKACAEIVAAAERLACYDQVAGRAPSPAAPVSPPRSSPGAAAIAPARPPGTAPTTASVGTSTSAPSAAVAAPAPPGPPPKEAFGLYAAEHPHAVVDATPSLTALVIGFGMSPNGHPTVTLEGGALWELDNSDPLLKTGESVIIKRAALGSFLMTTPTGRTHRVRRLH